MTTSCLALQILHICFATLLPATKGDLGRSEGHRTVVNSLHLTERTVLTGHNQLRLIWNIPHDVLQCRARTTSPLHAIRDEAVGVRSEPTCSLHGARSI